MNFIQQLIAAVKEGREAAAEGLLRIGAHVDFKDSVGHVKCSSLSMLKYAEYYKYLDMIFKCFLDNMIKILCLVRASFVSSNALCNTLLFVILVGRIRPTTLCRQKWLRLYVQLPSR